MERAAERGLEAHAAGAEPLAEISGGADGQARELLVGLTRGNPQQVVPELVFGVGAGHDAVGVVVQVTEVARVTTVAAAVVAWRAFEQEHAGATLPGGDGGA